MLPESFRWLLANQKEEDAMKVAQKYVNINKIPLPESVKDDIHVLSEEIASLNARTIKGNLKDLLKSSSYRRTSCIMFYGWLVAMLF